MLIADDDSLNRMVTKTILMAQGIEVTEVINGLEFPSLQLPVIHARKTGLSISDLELMNT